MDSVNSLASERFAVVAKIDTASVTNAAVESGWFDTKELGRLCAIVNIGTVAGANKITVSLRRASDISGAGDEEAAVVGSFMAEATTVRLLNYDLDRQKGNEKRFVRLRVIGNSANAAQLTAALLSFDNSFKPGSLSNIAAATVVA